MAKFEPVECLDAEKKFTSYVYRYTWLPYMVMGITMLVYGLSAIYFYASRYKVSFMTRSPLTTAIGVLALGIDSILNTLIFSEITIGNLFHW